MEYIERTRENCLQRKISPAKRSIRVSCCFYIFGQFQINLAYFILINADLFKLQNGTARMGTAYDFEGRVQRCSKKYVETSRETQHENRLNYLKNIPAK